MPATIDARIATAEGPMQVKAWPMTLKVGDKERRFIVHPGQNHMAGKFVLTHRDSGMMLGEISGKRLQIGLTRMGQGRDTSYREAAEAWLSDLVARVGADKVLAKIDAAPVLPNG